MKFSRNQHTIASTCVVSGRGYWSAKEVSVVMHPAPLDTGIRLVRSDLPGNPGCEATVINRSDANLRTNIESGDASFQMIEHLMAALYALEIDNCIVEIDGEELPGLDGSSKPYVDALSHAGLIVQAAQRKRLVIQQVITLREGSSWITASPVPTGISHFGYQLAFDCDGPIAEQSYGFSCTPINFTREVAPARTFVTLEQANALHQRGVARHVGFNELLVFGDDGPVENELKYRNECARHKALDLVGDLSLVGCELVGKFISHRGGHSLNGRMAKALYELAVQQQRYESDSRQKQAA
ncbi:UDP-3-O-acyl-N-acetylglucosamine deacetylase [Rhodopirellula sp. MGV]|uniref:UDP-3-O-acyl-N-acetylglucosamine deacetylase n=1 Tax=Rhodopirellula sp. MGV TaxID=2023130 RepID=UPI000B972646|nr:UDP-3-O-acyl-N-acetylglucosamine deacetylase [Rhodopirellula sp. MGV]OYP34691.1 UDP-3-O-[3-hydroxymyristoyl] N-acetylglucosamine deacetylase [Rhodopirellula sp. MGV]PNY34355.1 UDP-3-O-[3-hydroxymyristoyl] N-acetylglucosamine deacetylase [Rhodopirellula baltica]